MTRDVAGQDASTVAPPLTMEQQAVLQAVYDSFHEHAAWPTFIAIDRPIRRVHGWDAGAIVLSLPESLIVPARPGNLRAIESDGRPGAR